MARSCLISGDAKLRRYADLRTNLPREIMGFSDLPCIPECMGGRSRDSRRYPGSAEVRFAGEVSSRAMQRVADGEGLQCQGCSLAAS